MVFSRDALSFFVSIHSRAAWRVSTRSKPNPLVAQTFKTSPPGRLGSSTPDDGTDVRERRVSRRGACVCRARARLGAPRVQAKPLRFSLSDRPDSPDARPTTNSRRPRKHPCGAGAGPRKEPRRPRPCATPAVSCKRRACRFPTRVLLLSNDFSFRLETFPANSFLDSNFEPKNRSCRWRPERVFRCLSWPTHRSNDSDRCIPTLFYAHHT
jgi:hypothetical protein